MSTLIALPINDPHQIDTVEWQAMMALVAPCTHTCSQHGGRHDNCPCNDCHGHIWTVEDIYHFWKAWNESKG